MKTTDKENQIVSFCICNQCQLPMLENTIKNNPITTTADFNAFHVLSNFQLAQIKDTNYETTWQKFEY